MLDGSNEVFIVQTNSNEKSVFETHSNCDLEIYDIRKRSFRYSNAYLDDLDRED